MIKSDWKAGGIYRGTLLGMILCFIGCTSAVICRRHKARIESVRNPLGKILLSSIGGVIVPMLIIGPLTLLIGIPGSCGVWFENRRSSAGAESAIAASHHDSFKDCLKAPSKERAITTSSPLPNGNIFFPIDFESNTQEINELLNDTVYTLERLTRLHPGLQKRRISRQVLIDRKQTAENTEKAFEGINRDYPIPELDKNLDKELEIVLREIAIFNMKRENDISKFEELTRRLRGIGKQVKQQNQKVHQLHRKILQELQ